MKAVVSIYHDTRRAKKDGSFPVKIRLYDGRSTRWHHTGENLTVEEFKNVISGKKVNGDLLKSKNTIEAKKVRATEIVDELKDAFTHRDFEKKFNRPEDSGTDIFYFYDLKIKELRDNDQIKTSIVYQHASDSFRRFLQPKPTKSQPARKTDELRADKRLQLHFRDVDIKWLKKYQKWMVDKGNSLTTISMYLRTLRAIFNAAIKDKEISADLYPFTEDLYTIPTGGKIKQALEKNDLRTLWKYKTKDELIIEARDFWFFIFNAYGMNVRDIVQLKDTNIIGDKIFFVRQKTKNTTKKENIIEVPITAHMQYVIDKYGTGTGNYIFDILKPGMTEAERVASSDAFVTKINDHMERLANECGVMGSVTTYVARHSFGTAAVRKESMEFAQEALGHASIVTTQNYFKGFDDTAKRNVSHSLMDDIL